MDNLLYQELHRLTNATNFSDPIERLKYEEKIRKVFKDKRLLFPITLNGKDVELTRATKNDKAGKRHITYRRGWYNDDITKIDVNRCNYEGQQIFYCSDDPGTSVFEIRPNLGDWITTIKIGIKKDTLNLLRLGIFNDMGIAHSFQLDEDEIGVLKFLEDKFKETVDSKKYVYWSTATICNIFYDDCRYDGIIYPSVASNLKGHNFVLKKKIIDQYAIILDITTLEVVDYSHANDFKLQCICFANEKKENDELGWQIIHDCKSHKLDEDLYHYK